MVPAETPPPHQELFAHIDALLREKRDEDLRQLLLREDVRAVAHVINALEHGKRKTFSRLTPEKQAKALMLLSEGSRATILPRLSNIVVARLLHFFDEDDATDILQSLPAKRHLHILEGVQETRRKRIEKLLTFDPETAGGLMDLNFIECAPQTSVHDVIEAVHAHSRLLKQIPVVLLRTVKGVRWIPPRTLISGSRQAHAIDLSQPVSVMQHDVDREEVLERMGRENTDVSAVADTAGKLIGVIHANDLLEIAEAEASEDVYRMGAVGFIGPNYLESTFTTVWRKRVGWLSFLFVAELFTFTALSYFESSIASVTALALFVPLCISTGGNSGSQAATLITRAMALGHVTTSDWFRVLRRELVMGLALGVALGVVGMARAALTPQHILGSMDRWTIGIVIGQSVAAICLWGTLVGAMLPLLFKRLGFDPAYASSPFVATFVDVTGIVLYFSIANVFIL